ncbi:MAG: GLPGLI family protein [Saprospiraceae bacterium]|nr:GLPGLI family protein [Saprospiraceae bacterium]
MNLFILNYRITNYTSQQSFDFSYQPLSMYFFKLFILFLFALPLQSQVSKIEYARTVKWSEIAKSLPHLSKEEKDRISMTWGKNKSDADPYVLIYDESQAIYYLDEDNMPPQQWNWRREKRFLHTSLKDKKRLDNIEMLGKSFVFEDDMLRFKWKILNEIKEVAGYVCMKAETIDTVKNQKIVAWFASEIPVSLGPEGFSGLPGLILEIDKNNGSAIVTATKIIKDSISTPIKIPKKKGKKITNQKFDAFVSKHIKESFTAQRNPYWGLYY